MTDEITEHQARLLINSAMQIIGASAAVTTDSNQDAINAAIGHYPSAYYLCDRPTTRKELAMYLLDVCLWCEGELTKALARPGERPQERETKS